VSNESHFSTSGGKRERRRERRNEAKSQVFIEVIDSYPESNSYCRNVKCKYIKLTSD
jgi:hypothetical protein